MEITNQANSELSEHINSIETRLLSLEASSKGNSNAPSEPPIDLIEKSFKTVMDADIHMDNKASRILGAVAFLTAAAGTIFGKIYSEGLRQETISKAATEALGRLNTPKTQSDLISAELVKSLYKPYQTIFGIDWPLFAFGLFLLCILSGALLYLITLGPELNLPDWQKKSERDAIVDPKSLLFFKPVAETKSSDWRQYWTHSPKDLKEKLFADYVFETHLIAEKTVAKVNYMRWGSLLFQLALVCLIPLVASLFRLTAFGFWTYTFGGICITMTIGIVGIRTRPDWKKRTKELWTAVGLLTAIMLLLVLNCTGKI